MGNSPLMSGGGTWGEVGRQAGRKEVALSLLQMPLLSLCR